MVIVFIYADSPKEWNCSQWRSLTPSDAINRSGKHSAKLIHVSGFENYLNPAMQEIIAYADIIIFQRNLVSERIFEAIRYWQGMGKPVAVDLDDAYHILPWSNPAHKFWIHDNNSVPLEKLEYGLSLTNGLIAPNRLLLDDWKHVTKGYYLQNYAEKEWWENLPEHKTLKKKLGMENKIIIGWGGSVSHYDSWYGSGIMQAAKQICNRHSNVTWMICGSDKRIYDNLRVPKAQKIYQSSVRPKQWPHVVKHFDIGVAPLLGPYDQRRSWIKGLEYMLAGIPWIATHGEPYKDLAQYGILIKNNADNWFDAIENVIKKFDYYQHKSIANIETAKQWYADNQIDTFISVFEHIINDFNNSNISGRLPGLVHVSGKKIKNE